MLFFVTHRYKICPCDLVTFQDNTISIEHIESSASLKN